MDANNKLNHPLKKHGKNRQKPMEMFQLRIKSEFQLID